MKGRVDDAAMIRSAIKLWILDIKKHDCASCVVLSSPKFLVCLADRLPPPDTARLPPHLNLGLLSLDHVRHSMVDCVTNDTRFRSRGLWGRQWQQQRLQQKLEGVDIGRILRVFRK